MEHLPAPKGLLTIAEAARLLNLSYRTVHRATQTKELPTVRFLNRSYVPASAITRLLAGIPISPPSGEAIGQVGEVTMVA